MKTQIEIRRTQNPKPHPDETKLGFGKYFTDHVFVMDYDADRGWHDAAIIPYGNISIEPAAAVFHYGQECFEGMKAYRGPDNRILLFRPRKNLERLNISNGRVCIPPIDIDSTLEALKTLVKLDSGWIPSLPGTSLYIRPVVFATEPFFGVRPSTQYKFFIILSPVGGYYSQGMIAVSIHVETEYVRAVRGGTGYAKTGGNYAGGMKAQTEAAADGYHQVLWLDAIEHKYIEEVGAMNVFVKIGDTIMTPALEGTILPGITSASVLDLLREWGHRTEERRISIEEIFHASATGSLQEMFGTGTAAVISPIKDLRWKGQKITINNGEIGKISKRLYDTITDIQTGKARDTFGWTETL